MEIKPKILFLIDGCGAALSAFSLGVLLVHFAEDIGMPEGYLRPLALIAVFLAAYSFYCRFFLKTHFRLALLLLSSANFLYCLMTSALVFVTFDRLTKLGVAYFIAEALLILALVAVEFKTALQSKS